MKNLYSLFLWLDCKVQNNFSIRLRLLRQAYQFYFPVWERDSSRVLHQSTMSRAPPSIRGSDCGPMHRWGTRWHQQLGSSLSILDVLACVRQDRMWWNAYFLWTIPLMLDAVWAHAEQVCHLLAYGAMLSFQHCRARGTEACRISCTNLRNKQRKKKRGFENVSRTMNWETNSII